MKYTISVVIFIITLITLNCKMNSGKTAKLEKALQEAEDEKQIALEVQTIRADVEVEAKIKAIEVEAEMEVQRITESEATVAESIKDTKQKIATSAKAESEIAKQELQQAQNAKLEAKKQIIKIKEEMNQQQKQFIIAKLKLKIENIATILNIHTDPNWPEPIDQFGMSHSSQTWKDLKRFRSMDRKKHDPRKTYFLNKERSANDRRNFYLVFKYNKTKIQKYGEIFHRLMLAQLYHETTEIADSIINYAMVYFQTALMTLHKKQDNLNFLSLEDLINLKEKFDEIEQKSTIFENHLTTLYDDYHNNQYNIKDGHYTNIINYMNNQNYRQKLQKLIEIITNITLKITHILK
ncbi:CRASP family complement regulator-acquiring lipoprotein [Borrelia venezuelensis]|uniref:CRASP family complement regulator-acquiring lipoprotein n=1 Tax=Borrelia venezuelensis TaxID=1653839 RepID=UPI001FF4BE8E|nr:CRASP family complement regulator-acquiring lipoprotein [Borrelia venezuelensis]UPA12600.1 hypothetical protein bvRMA01_000931 [Borrelia venezuelensis]